MAELRPFEQHQHENGYDRQEELTFPDCDRTKQVRIGALLGKMAVFGGFDYDARGLTHEVLWGMREVFLLARAAVKIHRRPVDREILTIRTWEDGVRGAHMRRVYRMDGEDGVPRVSAKSDWVLVDPESRKLLRPGSFTARALLPCPVEIECPEPRKIRLPGEGPEDLGVRRIRWSDLDGNGHLFSGRYGDIVWDFLPEDLRERPVDEFQINYSREAVLGEDLRIRGIRDGDAYRMEGRTGDAVSFTAECVFV